MKIQSYLNEYELHYHDDFSFMETLGDSKGLFVIDRKVNGLYSHVFDKYIKPDNIILVDAIEEEKTIETALAICQKAMGFKEKRSLELIAVGGGIIQDIVGFAANILYRGVNLILVPTTLLAQADSCIGSKNSLNFLDSKNMLGTFYPPKHIHVCFQFLPTLSDVDYNSGLGEIIKFNIMSDPDKLPCFEKDIGKLIARDYNLLKDYIHTSHKFKKEFIEVDEFDLKERRLLNYAHTFGHAYEVISQYAIPHGLAIVLGMITSNWISVSRGILSKNMADRIEKLCLKIYNAPPLEYNDVDSVIQILMSDKKRQGAAIADVLMADDASLSVVQDVSFDEAVAAIDYTRDVIA